VAGKMVPNVADQVVCCPYCALGNEFRPMIQQSRGWFICLSCGHTAMPEDPRFRCFCKKCGELNRAA
jgi:Zn finger protein HypA/HybF involved in hydrogenase expression